ncbi:hypothetical protein [Frigoribacterium sp. RIT-PI-h]|jgi:hypothetical protein|uniref:hypothetical protein n=1 Tax=Frigoribacterium sp. RIT-PI-h TaxID=1690245 RepID=UPI000A9B7AD8|nr:hypothetical protein [Frigoribacterium sp. RIT-PI-h]
MTMERGLVEEQSVRTYGDVEAAAADFLRLLRNLARIEEIGAPTGRPSAGAASSVISRRRPSWV